MLKVERPGRFLLFIVVLIIALGLITFMIGKVIWGTSTLQQNGEFIIDEGSSAAAIWQQLVDDGFTVRTTPWRYYAWRLDAAGDLRSGSYQLLKGEHVKEVIQRLVSGDAVPDEIAITYPEGFTLQQFAVRTAANRIGTVEEFIQNAQPAGFAEEFPFLAELPSNRDLEGYLFPDTYRFAADAEPTDVIGRQLATFARKLTPELRAEAAAQGRTIDEIVIMASIIEREVQSDDDMALVSDVLWKRFEDDAGLGADATVRYALDKWDQPLTVQDLDIDSPYNTRKFRGLPPGPISNPGLRALQAAVRPTESDHYYYLSTPAGETIFSQTLDEHNANKARYLR